STLSSTASSTGYSSTSSALTPGFGPLLTSTSMSRPCRKVLVWCPPTLSHDSVQQFGYSLPARRDGLQDGPAPGHVPQVPDRLVPAGVIRLVAHEQIGDL